MRIHCLQHVAFEGLGSIETWIRSNDHSLTATRLYLDEPLPTPEELDLLIVMGGPMNVDEEKTYPWLLPEKRFLAQVINKGRAVLGICLGAQLLAKVLGARVFANKHKEIGWFPVTTSEFAAGSKVFATLPPSFEAFHWHGDTFAIPRGAVHIARSIGCENQAFIYDERIVGLQFHLETTLASAQGLIANCGNELVPGAYIQDAQAMLADRQRFMAINAHMQTLLNKISSLSI